MTYMLTVSDPGKGARGVLGEGKEKCQNFKSRQVN